MTWEIGLLLVLLTLMLASFAWEKIPAELTALTGFSVLIVSGLLSVDQALSVFSNAAPVTVGAMFVLGAALEQSGLIRDVARLVVRMPKASLAIASPVLMLSVGAISAFVNNTPVVVMFLPVALALAKKIGVPASKMLIPLSYAAILGGLCTVVGTSTNLVVSGLAESKGLPGFTFFELAWIGLPLALAGALFMSTIGIKLLPNRETISSIMSEEERREYILDAFVGSRSPLVGIALKERPSFARSGFRVLEIVRNEISLAVEPETAVLAPGDRIVLACSPSTLARRGDIDRENVKSALSDLGFSLIASSQGEFAEVALSEGSTLIGVTLREAHFLSYYRLTVIALHRKERNLRTNLLDTPLMFGDMLLLLGTKDALDNLEKDGDLVLIEASKEEAASNRSHPVKRGLVLVTLLSLVIVSAVGILPIAGAAIVAAVFLILTRCLSIHDAYKGIQWSVLFLIFAMLGFGIAMETSGASSLLARTMVDAVSVLFEEKWQPLALLICVTLVTTTLTEVLSNNAAAALMATLAIGVAQTLDVDPKPFLVAIAVAASASFATPIGYQTNTYVYGIGGYRFTDFLKVGIPMNILVFVITIIVVPLVWKF